MRLKGKMVMELTDVNTGGVETVVEENMVTNAVNDILGSNPLGVFYKTGDRYDDQMVWNSEMLPICPNMIGGILLFPQAVTEEADNIYPSSANMPVAYAANDVNATANTPFCVGVYAVPGQWHDCGGGAYFQTGRRQWLWEHCGGGYDAFGDSEEYIEYGWYGACQSVPCRGDGLSA